MEIDINKEDSLSVEAYLAGDERAFKDLLDRHLKPVYNFLHYMVKDPSAVEDLAQETFIKAWKNIHRFDRSRSFKTWIFTIAKNNALDFLKKKKTAPFSFFEDEEGNNRLENVPEGSVLPDEILEREDAARAMEEKLGRLPEKYRMILVLRYKDDFSLQEIAEILGAPYNTIKAYHGRALAKLKEAFFEKAGT